MPWGRMRQGYRDDLATALALRGGEWTIEDAIAYEITRRNGNANANSVNEARRHIRLLERLYGRLDVASIQRIRDRTQNLFAPELTPTTQATERTVKDVVYTLIVEPEEAHAYLTQLTPLGARILRYLIDAGSAERSMLRRAVQKEEGYREEKLFKTLRRITEDEIASAKDIYD